MVKTQYLSGKVQDFPANYVSGKTVLDVGCVQHSASNEADDAWLHRYIVRNAKYVLGLDLLESEVAELRGLGYDVVCGDAHTVSLGTHPRTTSRLSGGHTGAGQNPVPGLDRASVFGVG